MKILATLFAIVTLPLFSAEKSKVITHLEAGKKQTIVTYGTSLTAAGAWVKQMTAVLEQKFPQQATVINSGGSGKWSDWGVANLQQRVIDKKPDTVFIEFSINDSVERFEGSVPIAQKNLEKMIAAILKGNPQCEIILMTMTPGNAHPAGHKAHRKDIEKHYEMYRNVAKERKFLLIDHYPNWKSLQTKEPAMFKKYVPDSVHATPEGCAKIITPAILTALGL
jgi:acyl-CoA thioesterase-1